MLDQGVPAQVVPDQVAVVQYVPLQLLPVQVPPFQVPPCQLVAVASALAIVDELKVRPKMSRSPSRTTLPSWRCALPRLTSSEPVPLEGVYGCADADAVGSAAVRAAARLMRPLPCPRLLAPGILLAVLLSSALSW